MNFGDFDPAEAAGVPLALDDFLVGYRAGGGADSDMRVSIQELIDKLFGPWPAYNIVVSGHGTVGSFAATAVGRHLTLGRLTAVRGKGIVTDIGTATALRFSLPVKGVGGTDSRGPLLNGVMPDDSPCRFNGLGDDAKVYSAKDGSIIIPPVLGTWYFSGIYENSGVVIP